MGREGRGRTASREGSSRQRGGQRGECGTEETINPVLTCLDAISSVGRPPRGVRWLTGHLLEAALVPSRRRDCHFTGIPSTSVLQHSLKQEGGAAEWQNYRRLLVPDVQAPGDRLEEREVERLRVSTGPAAVESPDSPP